MSAARGHDPDESVAVPDVPDWIVRGGIATAGQLQRGAVEHLGVPGLFGFSVQRQPGKTVIELALAGRFPHAQISVAVAQELLAAASVRGYAEVRIVPSPGRGFHHTVVVPQPLPVDLAEAMSRAFTVQPNPVRTQQD